MQAELETVSNRAYRSLRERILTNDFKPGDQLPQQRLAKELGIGTNPLREAMVRLECEGLIESVPQWGSRVRVWNEQHIEELCQVRMAVECQTARLCAQRATDEELAGVRELGGQIDAIHDLLPRDLPRVGPMDAEFHTRIARYARCRLLFEEFRKQHVLVHMIRSQEILGPHFPMEHQMHIRLAEAIATRDPQHAEAEMRWHHEYNLKIELSGLQARREES